MNEKAKNILIIGAGVAGRLLDRDIRSESPHRVIGFIDDKKSTRVKIVGRLTEIASVVNRFAVDEIIIAIPSADGKLVREVLKSVMDNRIPVRIVPREIEVLTGDKVSYEGVKELDIESWLGRPLVKSGIRKLQNYYDGRTALVTGGAGSIGSEIVRQLIEFGVKKVIIYDNSEYLCYRLEQEFQDEGLFRSRWKIVMGDIKNGAKLKNLMVRTSPDMIFHVAAYKHVHLMEENSDEAVRVNIMGTVNVVDAAVNVGIKKVIFVSTDKAVNPTSIMGASKRVAEWYVQNNSLRDTTCNIVRFGNVINSRGSVLPLWEQQLRDRRKITITDPKMERFFMSIREAAQLVLASAVRSSHGQIYLLDMGDLIPLSEVARCFIRSRNLIPNEDVEIVKIGRRSGEKMKEELFESGERKAMVQTSLPNVWKLKSKPTVNGEAVADIVHKFEEAMERNSTRKLKELFKSLFPSIAG